MAILGEMSLIESPNDRVGIKRDDLTVDEIIWTSLYRTMPDIDAGCVEEPYYTYTQYNIFVLKSRLLPWLGRTWNKSLDLLLPSVERNNRMYVTILPIIGNVPIEMSPKMVKELQDEVNRLTSQPLIAALLISTNRFLSNEPRRLISSDWIDGILPFIGIKSELNPHMGDDGILIEMTQVTAYYTLYEKLLVNVIEKIRTMYDQGYVVDPPESIITNWNLITNTQPTESKHLYVPDWSDSRITRKYGGMFGFIQSRIDEDPDIDFFVGSNMVHRHHIVKALAKQSINITFVGSYGRVSITSLDQARRIASIIEDAIATGKGQVIPMMATRKSWIMVYFSIIADMVATNSKIIMTSADGTIDCLSYTIDQVDRPYVFSCMVNFGTNSQELITYIQSRAIQKLDQLMPLIPDITMSVHEAIEQNLVSLT